MGDHIIDTNVLLVASAHHADSPFKDTEVPAKHLQAVFKWLKEFREDGQRQVVLDGLWKIWKEYNNKLTGQDYGLLVVTEKLQSSLLRTIDIAYDQHGHGCLPPKLEKMVHDRSDRKFVAVALKDRSQGGESTIVNAVDSDWCDWEDALRPHGITVRHLIDDLYRDWRRKRAKR